MKHVFVINPTSGSSRKRAKFLRHLEEAAEALGIDYEIYSTKEAGDGGRYVKALCARCADRGDSLRVYACGGDGTLHEMVNGAYGFDNVEVGAIPMGTGNDYVRNYGRVSDFLDIRKQIRGTSRFSDLIHYRAVWGEALTEGYCVNMFNIGFDCNVVDLTAQVKRWPLISGSLAYLVSVLMILIKKKGADLNIRYEDGTLFDGRLLLIAIANGCYCGGGVKGVPLCRLDDGLMDVSVIKDVTRRFFISFFPSYARGTHLEKRQVQEGNIVRYTKEKALTVTANGESLRLCTDGEITTQKQVRFSAVKDGFRFIVPDGL